jgi:signal peptidase I
LIAFLLGLGLFVSGAGGNKDKSSPYDWIKPTQIFVYSDRVVIKIKNPEWSMFMDTNSMDPVIDSSSNAIEIVPKDKNDIHIGDIVAYKSKYHDGIITHRVVDIGYDSKGWYARLKGDNNERIDPGKVRFEQIKRVVVAIIY